MEIPCQIVGKAQGNIIVALFYFGEIEEIEMEKLRFYEVTDSYVDYCRTHDSKVPENKIENRNHPRKYIGVLLKIEGFKYFAPLSSPKTKHYGMKESVDFIKIEEGKRLYAVINLNNMIPVPDSEIIEFDFQDIQDTKYRDLLEKEFLICRGKKEKILKNASKLYEIVTVNKTTNFVRRCCDFKLLEIKSQTFSQQGQVTPELF